MGDEMSIVKLSGFLRSPPGQYVLTWEQQLIDSAVTDVFGYHALQLGLPEIDALRESRMPLRFCAASSLPSDGATAAAAARRVGIIHRYEELPFATHSIDLVVMPHILEFASDPHQVLREVERVLVPEGHVVITGFNPYSFWGARQYMSRFGARPYLPRAGHFIALPRIKDWLKLLSFDVERGRFGCYVPSVRSEAWLARWRFIDKAGDRWWPFLGAVYMLTAVKRVRGMRLVGAIWKRKEEQVRRLAPAATTGTMMTAGGHSVIVDAPDAANERETGNASQAARR
jgi:SAM-dependent methyltransferase